MSGTLLVTPDGEFETQVKRAFDGDLDADRFWDDHLPRTQPETAVRQIAQSHPDVVVLGPGLSPPVTLALAEAFDLLHPEVCVVIVAKPSTRLWERALQGRRPGDHHPGLRGRPGPRGPHPGRLGGRPPAGHQRHHRPA